MTIEFSRRKFMTSAGGTALTALAVPAAFKKLPGGEAQAVGRDFFSYPQAAVVQSLGEITGGLCYPAPVTAATARRRAGPSPACRVWGSRSAASGRARSWSTTRERSGRGTSAAASTATASTRPGSSRRRRSTFASSWRASRPRSRRWRPRGRRTSDRRARSRPGPGATRWPGTCSARARGRTRRCYPFGWISYTGFKTDVSMRFYTPIVAGEDRRTSLPLAYFDLRIANHTGSTADVSVMFTWPNAAESVDGAAPTVRTGLSNSADAQTGGRGSPPSPCRAMTRRTPPTRTARSGRSRPSRAPGRPSATCRRGTAAATGPTSTSAFSADRGARRDAARRLASRPGRSPSRRPCVPARRTVMPFALTWDFPQVTMNNNRDRVDAPLHRVLRRADDGPGGRGTGRLQHLHSGELPVPPERRQIAADALAIGGRDARGSAVLVGAAKAFDRKVPAILRTGGAEPARAGLLQDLAVGGRLRVIDRVRDAGPPGWARPSPGRACTSRRTRSTAGTCPWAGTSTRTGTSPTTGSSRRSSGTGC